MYFGMSSTGAFIMSGGGVLVAARKPARHSYTIECSGQWQRVRRGSSVACTGRRGTRPYTAVPSKVGR